MKYIVNKFGQINVQSHKRNRVFITCNNQSIDVKIPEITDILVDANILLVDTNDGTHRLELNDNVVAEELKKKLLSEVNNERG